MRTNSATGQSYPNHIRDLEYAVLATAPALPGGITTEVALVHLLDGSYTSIHLTAKGKVLEDEPLYTDREDVARYYFGLRTEENYKLYQEAS